ncbi:MAG TPA: hypothetical protein VKQ36_07355 [Ktedonobacterales bacterium]|nr:hypothetical protein [Ktedonobacterales bacterium]
MVLHYKAFSSAACNNDIATLEGHVNEWLAKQRPYVHSMAQSAHGEYLVISFLYEDDESQGAHRAAAVATATPDIFEEALRDAELDPTEELLVTLLPHAELPY